MSEFVVIANYWKGEAAVFLKSLNHSFKRPLPESHPRLGWPFAASFFFFFSKLFMVLFKSMGLVRFVFKTVKMRKLEY